jgi:hypothetical protein
MKFFRLHKIIDTPVQKLRLAPAQHDYAQPAHTSSVAYRKIEITALYESNKFYIYQRLSTFKVTGASSKTSPLLL